MRSQLRKPVIISGPRARMGLERPIGSGELAITMGLADLPAPFTLCRTLLTRARDLLFAVAGWVLATAVCATGCAGFELGVPIGPEATVRTTPVAV